MFSCEQYHTSDELEADLIPDDAGEIDIIQIEDMSNNRRPGQGSPLIQQLQWHENARNRVSENINNTRRQQNDYTRGQDLEVVVDRLTHELEEHKRYIQVLKDQLKVQDAAMKVRDEQNTELRTQTVQQAATIKHQSQLIQNPRSNIATPSHGQENIAPINPSYTAPPPGYMLNGESHNARLNGNRGRTNGLPMQSYNNPSNSRQYHNSTEQGSPGPSRITGGKDDHTRHSSSDTNPFASTPKLQQAIAVSSRSTRPTSTVDNSKALVTVGSSKIAGSADLAKGFEHVYKMVESFAKAHVNFVSSEKDGNMPQIVKQAILNAAAPVNAFPFMSKPDSRYHMVAKVMTIWINKEIMKGMSFATFNDKVDGVIESTRNKIFQGKHRSPVSCPLSDANSPPIGTPVVIKAMYMQDIANHVDGLMSAQGFTEWFQQHCRDNGNELWKLIKPMMHQKTTNDWNDMYALMHDANKLAVEMILSTNEFTFENVDIHTRFDPGSMINKESTMMGMSGEDLARRGAVVKLGVTPKVRARGYTSKGNTNEGLVYPATVLTKWAEVRGHRRN